jgi:hypothetical protein
MKTKMNNNANNEKLHVLMKKLEKEGMEETILINKKYERLYLTQEIPLIHNDGEKASHIILTLRKYYNIVCNKLMKRWNKQKEIEERRKYMNELEQVISVGSIEFEREMGRKMTFKEMRMIYG